MIGRFFFFGYDNWVHGGSLISMVNKDIINRMHIGMNAKVADVVWIDFNLDMLSKDIRQGIAKVVSKEEEASIV